MFKKLFLFLGLFAATASFLSAQSNNFQAQTAIKLTTGSEMADPLGLLESDDVNDDDKKKAGVKASVIVNMAAAEQAAFNQINQKRLEMGLAPLVWSDELAAVARLHSQNMAEFKFFSHRGLDNKLVSDRADQLKIGRWRSIGENIAFNRGFQNPVGKAVELWLDSPTHRRNMLDPNWKESAIGVAKAADGAVYFTQVFLVRK
ncbi:MAG: CAP domain-containing protein [Pyrinomonadaceae bacterium]